MQENKNEQNIVTKDHKEDWESNLIFFITLFEKDGLTFEKYFKYIYLHKFYQPQTRVRKEVYLERQKKDSAGKVRTKQKEVKKSKTGLKYKFG